MRLETGKYLYDIQRACGRLREFTAARRLRTTNTTLCCALRWSDSSKSSAKP